MLIEHVLKDVPKWDELKGIYKRLSKNDYEVTEKSTRNTISITDDGLYTEKDADFLLYKKTPESMLGDKIDINKLLSNLNTTDAIVWYETLLAGCIRMRMIEKGKNPDEANIEGLLNWLESTDFFQAPASSQYHDAHVRGLVIHTLRVYNKICDLWAVLDFSSVSIYSAVLTALCHDWCKIGLYESYERNVKNEETGVWGKVPSYRRKVDNCIGSFGHGVTSLFLASRFFKLSNEEALAIRWHMGEYNVCNPEMNELHTSNETYPIVQLLQFADRLSITKYFQ